MLARPGVLAPPPQGNLGSATASENVTNINDTLFRVYRIPKVKIGKMCRCFCISAHSQRTHQGYAAKVSGEAGIKARGLPTPPGQFIALQAFNVLKEILSVHHKRLF